LTRAAMRIDITIRLVFTIQACQQLQQQYMFHNIGKVACMEVVTIIHVSIIPKINSYFNMKN
jgi:hypothetical protein